MVNICPKIFSRNEIMKLNKVLILFLALLFSSSVANAQRTEITISLNEQFFDTLLDAIYQNAAPPEFSLSENIINRRDAESQRNTTKGSHVSAFSAQENSASRRLRVENPSCSETIRLLRELNGVRTAVRFRDGKIYAPLAFSGNYNPPLIGCVDFAGWAEANVNLEFDQAGQRLIARVNVLNVSLNGSGGVGGSVIARLVQSSIDKKINPVEIIRLDKVSFVFPIQNSGNLKMKAVGIRHEILNGMLNVHVAYEFVKA
jgi:hypothetical protein